MARPPKTHAMYLAELKTAKIKIKPLEPYQGAITKIKHLCTCGEPYSTTPNRVLRGTTCKRCAVKGLTKTQAEFEKVATPILKAKKIVQLEQYIGAKVKILFHCLVCDEKWKRSPPYVINHECPVCHKFSLSQRGFHRTTNKQVKVGNNMVHMQGYEPQAVKILLRRYATWRIKFGVDVPIVKLSTGRNYYPDMYIPDRKMLVEVKSIFTLGLVVENDMFKKVKQKALTAIADGYRYRLMVLNQEGRLYKLPSDWVSLSRSRFKTEFCTINKITTGQITKGVNR